MSTPEQAERILARIGEQLDADKCWLWPGARSDGGYGNIMSSRTTGRRRALLVHRVVFEHFQGPIGDGLELDHLCRVRHCCNPAHLEPVTRRTNVLRGLSPAAKAAKQTHCIRGHALTPDNVMRRRDGRRRECLTCHRDRERARKAAA